MRHLQLALAFAALTVSALAQIPPTSSPDATFTAIQAPKDVPLTTDPTSDFWKHTKPVFITGDTLGNPVPSHRTEVRARWTKDSLYLFFISPYEELNLKPSPDAVNETNRLWNWDVAETFIGSDFQNIRRYKEFEVSPQSEWVDLDIDLDKQGNRDAVKWDSGFKVSARVDADKKIWYSAMRIPFSSIDTRPAVAGNTLRIGLFRCQGPTATRYLLSWQPTGKKSFHVPERFGTLLLAPASK
jgi:hypothetical protein